MEALLLVLLGFSTGAYSVIVGSGAGFILAPVLIIFFDMEPTVVVGTSLALVAINALSGSQVYHRMGLIDYRSGLLFAAAAIPGAVLAPFILTSVPYGTFRILLGVLLLVLATQMMLRPRLTEISREPVSVGKASGGLVRSRRISTADGAEYEYRFNEALATSFNFFLGFMSSFFGTGGGFLRTPILVYAFNFPILVAAATSIFAITFYTTAGAITHASLGHIDYPTLVWVGIGLMGGAQVGARLAGKIGSVLVLRLLLVLLLGLGSMLLIQGITG